MKPSKIVSAGWEYKRWSLHDSGDVFVVTISNGEQSTDLQGRVKEEVMKSAQVLLERERVLIQEERKEKMTNESISY